ncbi:MAG: rRNA maturation RNase YbeY [Firmicutes bacterium]|nr:rRNA maturation RNase YbeY [Bacillota bacterium]
MQNACIISHDLEEKLQKLVAFLLQEEGRPLNTEVNIVLVDNAYISKLNALYRSRPEATDVLSFNLQGEMPGLEEEDSVLGDIFISAEKAALQAQEAGKTLEEEIIFLAAHGALHLLGYEHDSDAAEEKMQRKTEEALKYINTL